MASPITVIGEWDNGIVVDKYTETSMYIGDDAFGHPQFQTTYTKIGKLLHAMKYNGHFDTSEEIVNICIDTLGGWFTGKKIDIILPAPPSTERPSQPVYMVAEVLASKLGIFYSDEVLVKTSAIPAKNMPSYYFCFLKWKKHLKQCPRIRRLKMDYLGKKNKIIDSHVEKKSYYKMDGKTEITIIKSTPNQESAKLEELYKELEIINQKLPNAAIVIKKESQ